MVMKDELIRSNTIFILSGIIVGVLSFVLSVFLSRTLQPFEYGLYSFALIVVAFFLPFTDFGINQVVVSFTSHYLEKKQYGKIKNLLKIVLKYKMIVTIVIAFILITFSDFIAISIFNKTGVGYIILLSGVLILLESVLNFFVSLFAGLKRFKLLSIIRVLEKVFKFGFIVALVLVGLKSTGALLGIVIGLVVLLFLCGFIIKSRFKHLISTRESSIERRNVFNFSVWVFMGFIISSIYAVTDSFLISILMPVESIGFYRIGMVLVYGIVSLLPISAVLFPYFSGSQNKKELFSMFFNSMRYILIFILPLGFLLASLAHPIILFIYGSSFLPAVSALQILGFVTVPFMLSALLVNYFNGIKKPNIPTKIIVASFILNVILNYILIILYGLSGAATATLIASLFQFAFLLLFVDIKERLLKSSIFWKPLFSSIIIYFLASVFVINNIFELIFYGLFSLGIYVIIMFLIKGITRRDFGVIKQALSIIGIN
ncbi:MAG: oligosaccharide flippase family protein [Nanoarchaeota archaeon]|nr:oligosaccharide flippase family protein [Nanoarchaeota archaeon]